MSLRERSHAGYVAAGGKRAAARLAAQPSWTTRLLARGASGLAGLVRQRRAVARGTARVGGTRIPGAHAWSERHVRRGRTVSGAQSSVLTNWASASAIATRRCWHSSERAARSSRPATWSRGACPSRRGRPRPRSAVNCGRTRRASCTASSRSARVTTSATTAVRPSGPKPRTGGVTGWTSPAFPERAGSTARRSCAFAAT